MELDIPIPDNDIVVAVDSTGMKVTGRGDWMREKHGVERKGWIKVHAAADVKTIAGKWFMAIVGDGLQRVFSQPLNGSSARL